MQLYSCHQILYGFPLPLDKLDELFALQKHVDRLTVMIDCIGQIRGLEDYCTGKDTSVLSAYIKIDQGNESAFPT